MTQDQKNMLDTFVRIKSDIAGLPTNVKSLGVTGKGLVDDTAAIRLAMLAPNTGSLFFADGIYNVSAPIQTPDNLRIVFSQNAQINVVGNFAPNFNGSNDARYVFLSGNNCTFENVKIDVKGFVAGGIAAIQKNKVVFKNCEVKNWKGVYGICDIGCSSVWYSQNTIKNGVQGLHSFASTNVLFTENTVDLLEQGGIWAAWSYRVTVMQNIISNCGDYGIGFEGGAFCTSMGNTVEACKNGELSLYSGNGMFNTSVHHLIHKGNTVIRKANYVTAYNPDGTTVTAPCDTILGSCSLMSIAAGSYEVGFDNNHITVEKGIAYYHAELGDTSDRKTFFSNNTVISNAGFFRCMNSMNLRMTKNTFQGKTGSEAITNEVRDAHGLVFTGNEFAYDNPKTTNFVLLLNTSGTYATKAPLVANNTFTNAPGLAIQVDLYRNSALAPIIRDNYLGDTYTANGGIDVTANGSVVAKNQKLKIRLADGVNALDSVTLLQRCFTSKAFGHLGYGRPGYNGAFAQIHYIYGTGFGGSVGVSAPNISIAIATSGITLTNNTGTPCAGYLDLEFNSY